MSLFISKLIPLLIYPLGAAISLSLLAWLFAWWGRRGLSKMSLVLGISYLWLASTPVVAFYLTEMLEGQHPPVAIQEAPERDVIILLGGALDQPLPPRTESDLLNSADRVLTAARLYRTAKAKHILVTGGNLPWQHTLEPEAVLIRDLLVEWEVPADAIVLETDSRNTVENAHLSKVIMEEQGWETALLVTSATHMRRAAALFSKAGMDVFPVPTDYRVTKSRNVTALDWLPDVDALKLTTTVIREWAAMLVYRWRGWA